MVWGKMGMGIGFFMGMGGNGNGNGFMGMGGNGNRNSPSRTPLIPTGPRLYAVCLSDNVDPHPRVILRRAWLVLGWVTVSSRVNHPCMQVNSQRSE